MSNCTEPRKEFKINVKEFRAKFEQMTTSLVWDKSYGHVSIILGLHNVTPKVKLNGPAFVVETESSIMPILQALHVIPEDYVLVVNDIGNKPVALLGDIIVRSARVQRLAGIVVNGSIRDVDEIPKMDVSVWAGAFCIQAAELGRPLDLLPQGTRIGQNGITNGDWIFGDANGILCISKAKIRLVLKSAELKNRNEKQCISRIDNGEKITDQMNLDAFLSKTGSLKIPF